MMRMGIVLLGAVSGLFACARDSDPDLAKKLDRIIKQNDDILDELRKGGGVARGASPRPQRPRPSPTEVYAVPIEGAPFVGSKDAKVTIVEAFEFA